MELIFGSMYSGKTEELLRRLRRCTYAGQSYILFKPAIDNRYSNNLVVTHDIGKTNKEDTYAIKARVIKHPVEMISSDINDYQVVGIDEAQFFTDDLINVIHQLESRGIRVIISALDLKSSGKPFNSLIGNLACLAKYVTKLHGVCVDCGSDGYISYKTDGTNTDIVDVGSVGKYICLCEKCAKRRDAYEK